jgi:hypothetical protein
MLLLLSMMGRVRHSSSRLQSVQSLQRSCRVIAASVQLLQSRMNTLQRRAAQHSMARLQKSAPLMSKTHSRTNSVLTWLVSSSQAALSRCWTLLLTPAAAWCVWQTSCSCMTACQLLHHVHAPGFSGSDEDPAVCAIINGDSSTVVQHQQGAILHTQGASTATAGVWLICTEQVLLVLRVAGTAVRMQRRCHTLQVRGAYADAVAGGLTLQLSMMNC